MKFFRLIMVTPEKEFFDGKVSSLKLMLADGAIEILASHIPSVACTIAGDCRILLEDGTKKTFFSEEGVLKIERNEVTITSEFLEWSEDLDQAIAKKQKRIDRRPKA